MEKWATIEIRPSNMRKKRSIAGGSDVASPEERWVWGKQPAARAEKHKPS